jgi:integrase
MEKNGKKITCWYYWYWKDGKQVRKTCGTRGKPCTTKKEAMAFIASLDKLEDSSTITLREACQGMFEVDSEYLRRLKIKGREIMRQTRESKRGHLNHILSVFGDRAVSSLRPADYDRWLVSLDISNSTRNNKAAVLVEMYQDMYYRGIIDNIPVIERYANNDIREKGILSLSEIRMLYPANIEELIDVWKVGFDRDYDTIQWAVMVLVLLTTGMRSGEVRALQYHQRIRPDAFLLNAMINTDNERVDHLKKGTKKDKKWRIAILPERTVMMLNYLESLPERSEKQTEYIFEYQGHSVTTWQLLGKFRKVLKKNGIDVRERNISVHSTRFTYNSIMRREIGESDLRLMIGHASQAMTEYYDKSSIMDNLPHLLDNKDSIDSVWSL